MYIAEPQASTDLCERSSSGIVRRMGRVFAPILVAATDNPSQRELRNGLARLVFGSRQIKDQLLVCFEAAAVVQFAVTRVSGLGRVLVKSFNPKLCFTHWFKMWDDSDRRHCLGDLNRTNAGQPDLSQMAGPAFYLTPARATQKSPRA